MQVRFMQRVDYYIGIPLCMLMTLVRKLLDLMRAQASRQPRKILFIELSEMGSAIIAYSAIKKAETLVGRENLYFLIFTKNRESVDLLGTIPHANVITIDDRSLFTFAVSSLRALLSIRRLQIDTVIDLELFSRCTALITYLSGALMRIGFHNYSEEGLYRGDLFTHKVYYNGVQHMALNFLALLGAINADCGDPPLVKYNFKDELREPPQFVPSDTERERVSEILKRSGFPLGSGKRLVIVNPDPGLLALRGWPLDKYVSVVREVLAQNSDVYVAVIGLARSREYVESLRAAVGEDRLLDLVGKTANLRELMTLFSFSEVLLTNDSGPAHMATLSKIKIIVLFGPETPLRYAPLTPRAATFFAGLACSPCYSAANHRYSVCRNNVCMQVLAPEPVSRKVNEMLAIGN